MKRLINVRTIEIGHIKMMNSNIYKSLLARKIDADISELQVFIMNRYPPLTSIYRCSADLSSILRDNYIQINLIFQKEGWEVHHEGIDIHGKDGKLSFLNYSLPNFAFRDAIKYVVMNGKKDKVVLHYTNQFSGVLNIKGIINVVNIHDSPYYFEKNTLPERMYIKRLYNSLKNVPFIITNTEVLRNELIDYGFRGHITTIHLPYSKNFRKLSTDKTILRKKLGLPIEKKLVLSVSTDSPRKNLAMVSEVVRDLGNDYRLVRVGSPLGDSITFNGIGDVTLNEIYNACDVLLFPSLYEGFGLPIVEAFASGLPVVTSDIPTIREVTCDAASLCSPFDIESLANSVKFVLDNADEFVRKGFERSPHFSFDRWKNDILSLYKKIEQEIS